MKNEFYTDFDCDRLQKSKRSNDYRTPFQIDRDRIIHSSEFRRLQGKTQVFIPGEFDFYRTRLTHSIEVAQIGRSICSFLRQAKNSLLSEKYFVDPDLVEAVCLAHDLGHPPFGHAGERTLNGIMKKYGGFEANAQTLRLITENIYKSGEKRRGMNPTRALIDGVLKYKSMFSDKQNRENHFLYDDQNIYVNFVFGSENYEDNFNDFEELNSFCSIECQIMDWADDTGYAINDIVDSISGGFIDSNGLSEWSERNSASLDIKEKEFIKELVSWIDKDNYKSKMGTLIGEFIKACSLEKWVNFMSEKTNRYRYKLKVKGECKARAALYKKVAKELVFLSPRLREIERKGNYMLKKIFDALEGNYIGKLSEKKLVEDFSDGIIRKEKSESNRARLICDHISGMTDSYSMRTYQKYFDINMKFPGDFPKQ